MPPLKIRLTPGDIELWYDNQDLLTEVRRDGRMALRYLVEHLGQDCFYPALADALYADRIGNRIDILKHAISELRLHLEGYLQSDAPGNGKRIWKLADRLDAPTFCLQKTAQNSIRLSRCDIEIVREADPPEGHPRRTDANEAQQSPRDANRPGHPLSLPPRITLPPRLDRFYGREEEIQTLTGMLAGPQAARLVTVTGTAGTGKTRLAIEAVERLSAPPDGPTGFVALAEICEPERVVEAARDALRLERTGDPLQRIAAALGDRPALLILDNYEQLLPAGAQMVPLLLAAASGLRLLVTSRRPLHLQGEREFPLLPLPVPREGEKGRGKRGEGRGKREKSPSLDAALLGFPSVQLFADRAQAGRPGFQITELNAEAVARLCQRLDGLPLAIELAAARSGVSTPAEMLDLLEDRFRLLVSRQTDRSRRHRSLQAAIDASYQALPPDLQALFARLSVFRGGWTLDAATALCAALSAADGSDLKEETVARAIQNPKSPLRRIAVLDALNELRDRSLVLAEEQDGVTRFRMLESLREFAREQLEEQLTEAEGNLLHQWHADHFLALIETAVPHSWLATSGEWLDRLEADLDNLRAALDWTLASARSEAHLRAVTKLGRLWTTRGHLREGRERLERALAASPEPSVLHSDALQVLASVVNFQDDNRAAVTLARAAVALARQFGVPESIAAALTTCGYIAWQEGEPEQRAMLEESIRLYEQIGDRRGLARAWHALGSWLLPQGDPVAARACFERSLALREAIQDRNGMATSLHMIGAVLLEYGDAQAARPYLERALALRVELGDRRYTESARIVLGRVAYLTGDDVQAETCFMLALETSRELDSRLYVGIAQLNLGQLRLRQGAPVAARASVREALTILRDLRARGHLLVALEAAAWLAQAEGDPTRAVWLFEAGNMARETLSIPATPNQRVDIDPSLEAARETVGAERFAALRELARQHTLQEAIAVALHERSLPAF